MSGSTVSPALSVDARLDRVEASVEALATNTANLATLLGGLASSVERLLAAQPVQATVTPEVATTPAPTVAPTVAPEVPAGVRIASNGRLQDAATGKFLPGKAVPTGTAPEAPKAGKTDKAPKAKKAPVAPAHPSTREGWAALAAGAQWNRLVRWEVDTRAFAAGVTADLAAVWNTTVKAARAAGQTAEVAGEAAFAAAPKAARKA